MSKLYNKSRVLGCKNPQKSSNSPQTGGKTVLPAQECENLENPTCSTQLATPFAAPEQSVASVKFGNGVVEQGAACGKFGNGVELGIAERCYVAGDETGSTLSGHSTKTQQILANTHKCFVQKANNNTNAACRTTKKQFAWGDFCYGSARKSRAHAGDKLACNNCGNTLVRARSLSGKSGNGAHEQCVADGKSAKKHSKVLRAVACGCLAIVMSGTAFLGTACSGGTPANVGLNGGSAASMNAGQGAGSSAANNLIFDDSSEPVFTTKSGVEIRYANAPATSIDTANGCYYFNLGTYKGSSLRWYVVGIGSKNSTSTNNPAQSAIDAESAKQTFGGNLTKYPNETAYNLIAVSSLPIEIGTFSLGWDFKSGYYAHASVNIREISLPTFDYTTLNLGTGADVEWCNVQDDYSSNLSVQNLYSEDIPMAYDIILFDIIENYSYYRRAVDYSITYRNFITNTTSESRFTVWRAGVSSQSAYGFVYMTWTSTTPAEKLVWMSLNAGICG